MARKVAAALGRQSRGKTIGVLGLTFKPNTDDMREAPSIPLITALQDLGAVVRAYDPVGMDQAKQMLPGVTYCDEPLRLRRGRRRAGDRDRMGAVPRARSEPAEEGDGAPVVVDLRNIYRPDEMAEHGFTYESVGRPADPRRRDGGPGDRRTGHRQR